MTTSILLTFKITKNTKFTTQQLYIAIVIPVSRSCALMFWKFRFCERPVYSIDLIPTPQLSQRSELTAGFAIHCTGLNHFPLHTPVLETF